MFSLTLQNKNGDQLTFEQNSPFTITEIQGLNPPEATINTSEVALLDGAKYNGAKINMRQINVAFAIEYSAAYNRIEVYKVLKSKQWVRMYYVGDYRNVYIDGYITSIDISYFEMKQIVTCGILCPEPFFQQAQQIIDSLSNIINAFHFPFYGTGGTGKNLIDFSQISFDTYYQNGNIHSGGGTKSDNTLVYNIGLYNNIYFFKTQKFWFEAGEIITISADILLPSKTGLTSNQVAFGIAQISGSVVRGYVNTVIGTLTRCSKTLTVPATGYYELLVMQPAGNSGASSGLNCSVSNIQIEKGSTATEYEPYIVYEPNIVFGYIDPLANITVENDGDVETGLIFTLIAKDDVSNPKIFDYLTGDFIGLTYNMQTGDEITIDTRKGHKTITLLRDGVESNIFNALMKNSKWLMLPASGSVYTYEVGTGDPADLTVRIAHYALYEGV